MSCRRSKGSFAAQRIAGLARHRGRLDELIVSSLLAQRGPAAPAAVRSVLA